MLIDLQAILHVSSGFGHEPSDASLYKTWAREKTDPHESILSKRITLIWGWRKCELQGKTVSIRTTSHCVCAKANIRSAVASPRNHSALSPGILERDRALREMSSSLKKYVPDPALARGLTGHPYRVTGQLFFDASTMSVPAEPYTEPGTRLAVGDTPGLQLEVCKAGSPCDENNDADWCIDIW